MCEPCWPRHASGTGRSHVTLWSHKPSPDTGRCWLPGCAGEHRPAAPRSRQGPGSCAPARQARWRTVWRSVEPLLKGTAVRCTSRAKRTSRSAWAYRTRTTTCRARRLRRVPGHRARPRLPIVQRSVVGRTSAFRRSSTRSKRQPPCRGHARVDGLADRAPLARPPRRSQRRNLPRLLSRRSSPTLRRGPAGTAPGRRGTAPIRATARHRLRRRRRRSHRPPPQHPDAGLVDVHQSVRPDAEPGVSRALEHRVPAGRGRGPQLDSEQRQVTVLDRGELTTHDRDVRPEVRAIGVVDVDGRVNT